MVTDVNEISCLNELLFLKALRQNICQVKASIQLYKATERFGTDRQATQWDDSISLQVFTVVLGYMVQVNVVGEMGIYL